MKCSIMVLLMMISILIIAGRSNGRMLNKNEQFIVADILSASDPNLNALFNDESSLHTADGHMEKDEFECVQEMISSSSSKSSTLSFRISPTVQKTDKKEIAATSIGRGVNSMVTKEQLSTSSSSPGVGHMQMIRHKSQSRNVDTIKSHHSNVGDEHLEPKKSNKRKLGSSPSPGGGN